MRRGHSARKRKKKVAPPRRCCGMTRSGSGGRCKTRWPSCIRRRRRSGGHGYGRRRGEEGVEDEGIKVSSATCRAKMSLNGPRFPPPPPPPLPPLLPSLQLPTTTAMFCVVPPPQPPPPPLVLLVAQQTSFALAVCHAFSLTTGRDRRERRK